MEGHIIYSSTVAVYLKKNKHMSPLIYGDCVISDLFNELPLTQVMIRHRPVLTLQDFCRAYLL